tara:strand:+ start:247 stop:618 length:372 start_codon:yes stop_codon:yes gene_type:complete
MKLNKAISLSLAVILQSAPTDAIALEKDSLLLRGGYTNVDILGHNGNIASVGDSVTPTLTFTYLLTDYLGVELLTGLPFLHSIYDKALGMGVKVGDTKHLPPALMFQYYFNPSARFRPYIGVG